MKNSAELFGELGLKVEKNLSNENKDTAETSRDTIKINQNNIIKITKSTRDACVKACIIPEAYINSEFNIEKVRLNYTEQSAGTKKYEMINFEDYLDVTCHILSTLRAGKKLDGSYIIGAPNGMGKTSFAHTALMIMYERRMNIVPYISLSELAEIKVENERRIARGIGMNMSKSFNEYNITYQNDRADNSRSISDDLSYYADINNDNYYKKPTVITGQFSWSEYINADVLICFLSGVATREIESHVLKTILEIRGAKGLPTIVTISTSLNPYKNHATLGPFIWQEILTYSTDKNKVLNNYDRLEHISCFRVNKGV